MSEAEATTFVIYFLARYYLMTFVMTWVLVMFCGMVVGFACGLLWRGVWAYLRTPAALKATDRPKLPARYYRGPLKRGHGEKVVR